MRNDIHHILSALQEVATEKREAQIRYFAPGSQEVLGVSNPDIQQVIRDLKEIHRDWEASDWIALSKELVSADIFECQVMAYELIARNKKLLNALSREDLKSLWRNLDNWASVDTFTVGIYGVLWAKGLVRDEEIHQLVLSENLWDRRVAVVATVPLNLRSRGGTGDSTRTLAVCREVVDDKEDLIRKALSWALRSLIYWDPEAVRAFLNQYEKRLAGLVLREVRHKLEYGTKN